MVYDIYHYCSTICEIDVRLFHCPMLERLRLSCSIILLLHVRMFKSQLFDNFITYCSTSILSMFDWLGVRSTIFGWLMHEYLGIRSTTVVLSPSRLSSCQMFYCLNVCCSTICNVLTDSR